MPIVNPLSAPPVLAQRLLRALRAPVLPLLMGALNHVLAQQTWARERLGAFAGRRIRLALDPQGMAAWAPPLDVVVTADGLLSASPFGRDALPGEARDDVPVDVCLWWRLSPDLLGALAGQAPDRALAPFLRIEGDVALATVLGELAQHLRWDPEDDLGRLLGDVPARRLSLGIQGLQSQALAWARQLEQGVSRLLTVGDPPLVGGQAFAGQRAEIEALKDQLDAVAVRIARLQGGRPGQGAGSGRPGSAG